MVGIFISEAPNKQALLSTSSIHAEIRAIYTLVKDLQFLTYMCFELQVEPHLPAMSFEDNSAVIIVTTTEENAYVHKEVQKLSNGHQLCKRADQPWPNQD